MSQNNNINEFNNTNITDDSLGLSDEMIQAYMDANALETPDLWARIENGFDREIEKQNEENQQANVPQANAPLANNVIDLRKRMVRRKTMAAIAAVVIICIIAVPVMKMVGEGNQKNEDAMTTAVGEDAAACQDATIGEDGAACDTEASYGGSDKQDEDGWTTAPAEDETLNENPADISAEASGSAEEPKKRVTVSATGYFVYDGDSLTFEIESMNSSPIGKIAEQTSIVLHDSDRAAAKYFDRVENETTYGPFDVQIDIDEATIDDEQPTGVLRGKASISK